MHTLDTARALFNISISTLKRWCQRAHIILHQDPADMRRRYLDDDQLLLLARLHNRVLMVDSDAVQLSVIERLEARIAELERRS
jgi:hypothetical protein